MKNIGTSFLALAGLAFIISSCATGNKYSKTGFGGGFGEDKELAKSSESVANTEILTEAKEKPSPKDEVNTNAKSSKTEILGGNPVGSASANLVQSKHHLGGFKTIRKAMKTMAPVYNKLKDSKAEVNTGDWFVFVLMFILCLIIPPLAYYLLMEKTDFWFWACLALFLLSLGVFFGITFYYVGLASIVIAMLALFMGDKVFK